MRVPYVLLLWVRLLYNESVRSRFVALILFVSITGCASQPVHSKTVSKPTLQAANSSGPGPDVSVVHRVTLPYTFTRHGVEIRATSIEFAGNQVLVNLTLQETRGQAAKVSAPMLIQALSSAGQELPYSHYSHAGETRTDPVIHLGAHDEFSITLFYQPSPGSADTPGGSFELRFPTGKYWSSQARE
jgi:hypothetical protein